MVDHRGSALAQLVVGAVVIALLAGGVWFAIDNAGARTSTTLSASTKAQEGPPPPPPLAALVPEGMSLVVSMSQADLTWGGWRARAEWLMPFLPSLAQLKGTWLDAIQETTVADKDPLHALGPSFEDVSLEGDAFGEVVLAGPLPGRRLGPVGQQRTDVALVLARVSSELADVLSRTELADVEAQLGDHVQLTDLGDGIVRFHSTLRRRPDLPEPVRFLFREGQVVAIARSESVIRQVAALAACPPEQLALAALADETPVPPRVGLAAHVDLGPIQDDLNDTELRADYTLAFLRCWGLSTSLEALGVTIDAEFPDVLRARGRFETQMGRLGSELRIALLSPPLSRDRIAAHVPARETAALLTLTGSARLVLRTLELEETAGEERVGWWHRIHDEGAGGLAARLGDAWGLASASYRPVGAALDETSPWPARAFLAEFAEGATAADVRQRLEAVLLDLEADVERREHGGRELFVLRPSASHDERNWSPTAYFVADEHVVFTDDVGYLERFVETHVDPEGSPPLDRSPDWERAMSGLPPAAHAYVYVDIAALNAPARERREQQWLQSGIREEQSRLSQASPSDNRWAIEQRIWRLKNAAGKKRWPPFLTNPAGLRATRTMRRLGVAVTADRDGLDVELCAPIQEPEKR